MIPTDFRLRVVSNFVDGVEAGKIHARARRSDAKRSPRVTSPRVRACISIVHRPTPLSRLETTHGPNRFWRKSVNSGSSRGKLNIISDKRLARLSFTTPSWWLRPSFCHHVRTGTWQHEGLLTVKHFNYRATDFYRNVHVNECSIQGCARQKTPLTSPGGMLGSSTVTKNAGIRWPHQSCLEIHQSLGSTTNIMPQLYLVSKFRFVNRHILADKERVRLVYIL